MTLRSQTFKPQPFRPPSGSSLSDSDAAGAADVATTTDADAAGIASGARVLREEAAALLTLAERLDGAFAAALRLLTGGGPERRIVVTGMGKSGHVGRKIAATLASTGTPALFVHPGEAGHGDLGMITLKDAVLALSNSGDTVELSAIIAYCRRFGLPLIGMTSRARSALAEQADVVLLLPPVGEACPLGLAPTTSTTLMLALGDALAVAVLERRGFTASDFQRFHPGGQLGRALLKVCDVMHAGAAVPLATPEAGLDQVILEMSAKRFGCVGIVTALPGAAETAQGPLLGIITDGDLRRHMAPSLFQRTAREVMTADPKTIRPQALLAEAIGQMNAKQITSLFVTEEERLVGIVHIHDCLKAGVV